MPTDTKQGPSIVIDSLLDQLKCYRVTDGEKQQLDGKREQLRYLVEVYQYISTEIKPYNNAGNDLFIVPQQGKPDLLKLRISITKDNDFKTTINGLCEKLSKLNLFTDTIRISFIKESDRLQALIGFPIK